uniref:ShKT domain-containing protein n=1 Tax=Panagrolaimus sp. JU765 TaxID=591449 RepID=A0AC34QPF5_9BILA
MKLVIIVLVFSAVESIKEIRTRSMPCCSETIGTAACQDMLAKHPVAFRERCRSNADFGIIQCCKTCGTNVGELGRELFAEGTRSKHCFDRHNRRFCNQFLQQIGMWAGNNKDHVSCNGESAPMAFRICRRTCGFCDPEIYDEESAALSCPQLNQTRLSFMAPVRRG